MTTTMTKTSDKKLNSHRFEIHRSYSMPFNLTNIGKFFRGQIPNDEENSCLELTSSTRREIRRVKECGECISAIAFSLSEHLVTNDLEPSENTHLTENQAKQSGVLYFVFPQVNEGVRNQENTDRLEWLQAHVNLESIGKVRNRFLSATSSTIYCDLRDMEGNQLLLFAHKFCWANLKVEKSISFIYTQ